MVLGLSAGSGVQEEAKLTHHCRADHHSRRSHGGRRSDRISSWGLAIGFLLCCRPINSGVGSFELRSCTDLGRRLADNDRLLSQRCSQVWIMRAYPGTS